MQGRYVELRDTVVVVMRMVVVSWADSMAESSA